MIDFDKPELLSDPIDVTHKFVGGPMDGQVHSGKVRAVMNDHFFLTFKGAMYQYVGNDTMKFVGMNGKYIPPKLNRLQRVKKSFLEWLLK